MTRIIRAELLRLLRRRTVLALAAGSVLFSVVSTLAVFSSARAAGVPPTRGRGGTTLDALTGAGGGTEAFAVGASFLGFLVFVTFIALLAGEFSGGTFRALLLRHPHRLRLVAGKLAGILVVTGAAVAAAEAATFVASLVVAPSRDVSTAGWLSLRSLGVAAADYATVFAGVAGWAVFGTALAVVFRSTPIALGVGFAWAGPFENIVVDSWPAGYRLFPGQVLASLIRGGSTELALGRSVLTAALYAAVAGTVALVLVHRRDVAG